MLAIGAVIALVALATLLAWLLHSRKASTRVLAGEEALPDAVIGPAPHESVTLLQFSTAYCSRCPGNLRMLRTVAEDRTGVDVVQVDLTERAELASQLRIMQTPTTFVVGRDGVPRARLGGPVTTEDIEAALEASLETTAGGTNG